MYPRVNYEMTDEEFKEIAEACRPVPYIKIGNSFPPSQQDNANAAWKRLGDKRGFDSMTVSAVIGKGGKFFSAIPVENKIQRDERLKHEVEEKKVQEINKLQAEIKERQERLKVLGGEES